MLAAINANSLDDFTIDKWLDNNGDCDDLNLLRSDLVLDNNEFAHNYRTFAKNETHLMEQLEDDLWSLLDTYYEPDTLDDEVFPFYIIDTDTKIVVKKIGLSIVHAIKTEILD